MYTDKPITVILIVEKEPVMEGSRVIIECAAKCNPQPHTYSWLRRQMGQNHEINSTQRKMPFNNITRDTSLSCIAHNDIGMGQSDWLDMNVQCKTLILHFLYQNFINVILIYSDYGTTHSHQGVTLCNIMLFSQMFKPTELI